MSRRGSRAGGAPARAQRCAAAAGVVLLLALGGGRPAAAQAPQPQAAPSARDMIELILFWKPSAYLRNSIVSVDAMLVSRAAQRRA